MVCFWTRDGTGRYRLCCALPARANDAGRWRRVDCPDCLSKKVALRGVRVVQKTRREARVTAALRAHTWPITAISTASSTYHVYVGTDRLARAMLRALLVRNLIRLERRTQMGADIHEIYDLTDEGLCLRAGSEG